MPHQAGASGTVSCLKRLVRNASLQGLLDSPGGGARYRFRTPVVSLLGDAGSGLDSRRNLKTPRGSSSCGALSHFAEGSSLPRGPALPVHQPAGVPAALAGTPGTHEKCPGI